MRFGLWVEPECGQPRQRPLPGPPGLGLPGRRPAADHRPATSTCSTSADPRWSSGSRRCCAAVLADHRISYLKWDMNRPVTDGGRPGDARRPAVGGAARPGLLPGDADAPRGVPATSPSRPARPAVAGSTWRCSALTDVVWTSDETGPRDRLAIQHGFLSAYGPHVMSSWVTDEADRRGHRRRRASSSGSSSRWPGCSASAPTCWPGTSGATGPGRRAGHALPRPPAGDPSWSRRAARRARPTRSTRSSTAPRSGP